MHGAGRHLDVGMVCWDGGVKRQCGWSNGQVGRWICRWVKVDRRVFGWKVRRRKMNGRRLCKSEGQAQESVDLSVRLG